MSITVRQNRGLVKVGKNRGEVIDIPIPSLRDDYILVKTIAVALNPADWQNLDEDFEPGSKSLLMGHDAAGIIEEIGKNVTSRLKKGDRVIGIAHGGKEQVYQIRVSGFLAYSWLVNIRDPEDGSFAEHIQVKGDISIRIPSHLSFTDAATLPCGLVTVGLGFYKHLRLPLPPATVADNPWVLVYGGSSATGTLAIQFAKLYAEQGTPCSHIMRLTRAKVWAQSRDDLFTTKL